MLLLLSTECPHPNRIGLIMEGMIVERQFCGVGGAFVAAWISIDAKPVVAVMIMVVLSMACMYMESTWGSFLLPWGCSKTHHICQWTSIDTCDAICTIALWTIQTSADVYNRKHVCSLTATSLQKSEREPRGKPRDSK